MVESATSRRAPLHEIYQPGDFGNRVNNRPGVLLTERRALHIIQVSAWQDRADETIDALERATGVRPSLTACSTVQVGQTAAIWVGPNRWLIVEKENRALDEIIPAAVNEEMAAVTDQSHSRCVIRLGGMEARNVLRKGTTLDMDAGRFRPGEAKTTVLFHINGLIHCLDENSFDVFVARSFGQSFFEVITHAAAEYGYRVEAAI